VFDGWTAANWVIQVGFNVAVYLVLGPKALGYMGLSLLFSIGLHPLGARWIQRHYVTHDGDQETFSYYGPLNKLAFNVGYHNEHHDFPSVAWDKLPRIREAAPDVYDRLFWHGSWTRLLFRFLFDPKLSLYARIVREDRGGVPLTDESTPEVEPPSKSLSRQP
jgi:sphingolipid delta-4 desaturase